jgi:hypothetical protein
MIDRETERFDPEHLEWAIDRRAEIQHTLLALWEFIVRNSPDHEEWVDDYLFDDLVAAGFSLWRAVFLADLSADLKIVHKHQEEFLARLLTTNAIGFADDYKNRGWTVSYYLENAKRRLETAHSIANKYKPHASLEQVPRLIQLKPRDDVRITRYAWECLHRALRIILKVLDPACDLSITDPQLPVLREDE